MGEVIAENQIDISVNKDGGVLKEIIKEGTDDEQPMSGDQVSVHYVGTLEDGTQFDSSRDRGEKFEFALGKGEVIKAWDLGVATMKKGEICKLVCRSEYAYGSTGSPPKIPPNATLIFEIELFSWKGEDLTSKKDGGIIRRILSIGEGFDNPNDGAIVDVKFVGRHNGIMFDEREVKFPLGEGSEYDVPEGLEKALEKFKKNEKSIINLMPKYGFGSAGLEKFNIPSNAPLEYEVTLKEFEKSKDNWEMDPGEKLEQSKLCKEKGSKYFSKEKYRLAIKQYKKITDYLQFDSGLKDEEKVERQTVLLAGYLNLSICYFKLKDYNKAKEFASKALDMDSSNIKAYFRRAKALMQLDELDLAKVDLEKCLKLDNTNKAAIQEHKICLQKIKEYKDKERNLYKGMFDKFAKRDVQKSSANKHNGDLMSGDLGEWQTDNRNEDDDDSEHFVNADNELKNVQMI